jgi:para-nitrobenzyl esterase
MAEQQVVSTSAGELRGAVENGVTVFRGIPYAAPPVGPLRFQPPQPPAKWSGVRDATKDGPIAPQGRSRLAHVMGDFERPQSEDCLTLNLWTPGTTGKRPVILWIHGGAFSSGAGSIPWYSGERFAANGDVVAISINYRLGALGFLYLPGISNGNLGLQDQVAALTWVRENIARFGGDPANVTVVGQSAGAGSIAALMTMPSAKGLFRRAILQSTPFGRMSRAKADAQRIGERFLDVLGLKPAEADKLRSLPVEKFLAAQGQLGGLEKKFADAAAPFGLVVDGTVISGDIAAALADGASSDVDVMVGTTREEMAAFYTADKDVQTADEAKVMGVFEMLFKGDARRHYDEIRRRRASTSSSAVLGELYTDRVFLDGTLRFAEARAARGHQAYVFQFDWQSPAGHESCHCIEIPFVFNNFANWPDAPMLKGADPVETAGLANAMHHAWIAFARSGNPNHPGLPRWPAYDAKSRMTMRFDTVMGAVSDLAGVASRAA